MRVIEEETRVDRLRAIALILVKENQRLRAALRERHGTDDGNLELELQYLQEQLAARTRELFGASSEKRSSMTEEKSKAAKPAKGHGPRAQPELPVVEQVHELDPADQICAECGEPLEEWAGQVECSEEIDVVARSYRIVRHQRKKYRCPRGHAIETALGPTKLIPGGRYSVDFAVDVAVAKYTDHRVPRRHAQPPRGRRSKSCCMDDEGRPLGIGVQAQVPNHLELRRSRAWVVSVEGNGAAGPRQVRSKKTNASEPLMTCREVSTRRRNRAGWLARDEPRGSLQTGWAASGMKAA